jgi:hypothetical protein
MRTYLQTDINNTAPNYGLCVVTFGVPCIAKFPGKVQHEGETPVRAL